MISDTVSNSVSATSLQETLTAWAERWPTHPLLGNAQIVVGLAISSPPQYRQAALEEAQILLCFLQQHETDAMHLDLAIIYHVITTLTGQDTLDRLIIPIYDVGPGRAWRHQERSLPLDKGRFPIHLVFMDCEQGPDLRNYVWLVHELVHVILARHLHIFEEGKRLAAQRIQEWTLAGLASDDPTGEQLSMDFQRYWSPGKDQEDWPHEIAVDTICMLLLGPAYAEALHHHYREVADTVHAYLIEPSHIPLELRTRAMIQMGEHLGWERVMQPLRDLQHAWEQQWPEASRASQYRALRDDILIKAAQNAALAFCEASRLQPLTPGILAAIAETSSNVEDLNGLELIIAAWWVGREASEEEYRAWGLRAVRSYAEDT